MAFKKKPEPKKTQKETLPLTDLPNAEAFEAPVEEADGEEVDAPTGGVVLRGGRRLISIHPSERKAWLSVDGKKVKVTYDVGRDNVARIGGVPGSGAVKLDDWLAGKVDVNLGVG